MGNKNCYEFKSGRDDEQFRKTRLWELIKILHLFFFFKVLIKITLKTNGVFMSLILKLLELDESNFRYKQFKRVNEIH